MRCSVFYPTPIVFQPAPRRQAMLAERRQASTSLLEDGRDDIPRLSLSYKVGAQEYSFLRFHPLPHNNDSRVHIYRALQVFRVRLLSVCYVLDVFPVEPYHSGGGGKRWLRRALLANRFSSTSDNIASVSDSNVAVERKNTPVKA